MKIQTFLTPFPEKKDMTEIRTIATHDCNFHADDVFAIAILKLLYPDAAIVRTRDPELLKKADLRVDVGFSYDPKKGDFDHHQAGGAAKRANGIEYAACGLIWKHFGPLLVKPIVHRKLDERLAQFIDAEDLGAVTYDKKIPPTTMADVIRMFNPLWNEQSPNPDANFLEAVEFAQAFLARSIAFIESEEAASAIVRETLKNSKRKDYIVLEIYVPWKEVLVNESEAKYVIYPSPDKSDWAVYAIPINRSSFTARKPLPKEWGGKKDADLAKVTGVPDAIFCHANLFIAKAISKAGAEKLAQLAIERN